MSCLAIILLAILGYSPAMVAYAIFLIEALLWLRVTSEPIDDRDLLETRLAGYAKLKGGSSRARSKKLARFEALKFEVALGIAKKAELKAAALLTIWAVIFTAVSALVKSPELLLSAGLVAMPPVVALIRMFRQIDSYDIMYESVRGAKIASHLRKEIIRDLICKERCFRFAYEVTFGLFTLSFVWIIFAHIFGALGRCP